MIGSLSYPSVCVELSRNVEYSDGLNIGSMASHQCANASEHQQIRCETTGWSGDLCGNNYYVIIILSLAMVAVTIAI